MNLILIAVAVLGLIGFVAALILFLASHKFAVVEDSRIGLVSAVLPQANCGGCGFPGCAGFASACVKAADGGSLEGKLCPVGGQAVMEGVMMKNPENGTALAVRQSDGTIVTEYYKSVNRHKKGSFPTWPVIRGVYAFVEALTGGLRITTRSAELLGTQFRLISGFGAGYGFDGVAMALIAQLHPLAAILVAIFFAALRVGSTTMQAATGVPTSVSEIIQALVIVFTVAGLAMVKLPEFRVFLERLFPARKEA